MGALGDLRRAAAFFILYLFNLVHCAYVSKAQASLNTAHTGITNIGGHYEYSFDASNLMVKAYLKTEMTTASPTTVSVAALIPYNAPSSTPDSWYALWCKIVYNSSTEQYTATVNVYDTQKDISSISGVDFDNVAAFGDSGATPKYTASTIATSIG